jgi:hypothetical protein
MTRRRGDTGRRGDVSSGAPAGSLEYFAVLFASAARRNDLRALYAFAAEIRRCSALTNHDIAHTRLQWWRQELDRCFAGDAQHPLTRTLQTLRTVIDPSDLTLLRERQSRPISICGLGTRRGHSSPRTAFERPVRCRRSSRPYSLRQPRSPSVSARSRGGWVPP